MFLVRDPTKHNLYISLASITGGNRVLKESKSVGPENISFNFWRKEDSDMRTDRNNYCNRRQRRIKV